LSQDRGPDVLLPSESFVICISMLRKRVRFADRILDGHRINMTRPVTSPDSDAGQGGCKEMTSGHSLCTCHFGYLPYYPSQISHLSLCPCPTLAMPCVTPTFAQLERDHVLPGGNSQSCSQAIKPGQALEIYQSFDPYGREKRGK
jgi:hypothetical protein